MSSGLNAKIRLVRCPKCRQVLSESPDILVYECGGCGTLLQAKNRNNNAQSRSPGLQQNGTAQTSKLDPSSEGTESVQFHGAVHPPAEVSKVHNNEDDQSAAGGSTCKQSYGVNLSHEDQNRIDGNGSSGKQLVSVNLVNEDRNSRSEQNEFGDSSNEPVGGVNFQNEDENNGSKRSRISNCNDDQGGIPNVVGNQNEVEDFNLKQTVAVDLPNEDKSNENDQNESEDCSQEQAEAANLPNEDHRSNAIDQNGSSDFNVEQPGIFNKIHYANECGEYNDEQLGVYCNDEKLQGVNLSFTERNNNSLLNESSESNIEQPDTLSKVCSTSLKHTMLVNEDFSLLAGANSVMDVNESPSLARAKQEVGDKEIYSNLGRSFPEEVIDAEVNNSNAVPDEPERKSISSGSMHLLPDEHLEQHPKTVMNAHAPEGKSISSDSVRSSPDEHLKQHFESVVNGDSPSTESFSSDILGSAQNEQLEQPRISVVTVLEQGEETILSDISVCSPNEHLEHPKGSVHHGFNHGRSMATFDSTDFIDPSSELSSALIDLSKSPTTKSSRAYYDDGFSSYEGTDDQVPDRHKHSFKNAFKPPNYAALDEKHRRARFLVNNNSEMQHQSRSYASIMSDEARYAMKASKFDRDELLEPTRLAQNWRRAERYELPSQLPFHERASFTRYENVKPFNHLHDRSRWRSSFEPQDKAAYTEHEKMRLLRMVYELQDQVNRACFPIEKANERNIGNEHIPLYYDHESAEVESLHDLNYREYPARFRERSKWSQQIKYSGIPFSAEATCSEHQIDHSLCCCPQDWKFSAQLPPHGVRHSEGFCMVHPHNNYNSYASCPASPQCHGEPDFPSHFRGTKSGDQRQRGHEVKKYPREKHQLAKRHLRPKAGGAPFLTCPSCLKLVKLPEDFLLFKRRCHRLRCGACSEVHKFSVLNRSHLVPYTPTVNAPPPSEVDEYADSLNRRNFASTSYASDCPHADPVSFSEDYGLTVCNSCSTDRDPVYQKSPHGNGNAVDRNVPPVNNKDRGKCILDEPQERYKPSSSTSKSKKENSEIEELSRGRGGGRGGSPLHRLMGYASPSQVMNRASPFGLETELS